MQQNLCGAFCLTGGWWELLESNWRPVRDLSPAQLCLQPSFSFSLVVSVLLSISHFLKNSISTYVTCFYTFVYLWMFWLKVVYLYISVCWIGAKWISRSSTPHTACRRCVSITRGSEARFLNLSAPVSHPSSSPSLRFASPSPSFPLMRLSHHGPAWMRLSGWWGCVCVCVCFRSPVGDSLSLDLWRSEVILPWPCFFRAQRVLQLKMLCGTFFLNLLFSLLASESSKMKTLLSWVC